MNEKEIIEKVNHLFDLHKKDWNRAGRKISNIDFEVLRQDVTKMLKEALSLAEKDKHSLTKQFWKEEAFKKNKKIQQLKDKYNLMVGYRDDLLVERKQLKAKIEELKKEVSYWKYEEAKKVCGVKEGD